MALSTNGINMLLDYLDTQATHVALHSALPDDSGSNELTNGGAGYARQTIAFDAATSKSINSTGTQVFDVDGGVTVAYVGLWSALTVGTFYGSASVTSEAFSGDGTYTITDFDISGV